LNRNLPKLFGLCVPDFIIGWDYLYRWYAVPKNRFANFYIHKFERSDEERALHDHPWKSVSFLIWGEIEEVYRIYGEDPSMGPEYYVDKWRSVPKFKPVFRVAAHTHRIVLKSKTAWTLFFTWRHEREWGFHCPNGWVPWQVFTEQLPDGTTRGCD